MALLMLSWAVQILLLFLPSLNTCEAAFLHFMTKLIALGEQSMQCLGASHVAKAQSSLFLSPFFPPTSCCWW